MSVDQQELPRAQHDVRIVLADERFCYLPGEDIEGFVQINTTDAVPLRTAQLFVLWYTRGKGNCG